MKRPLAPSLPEAPSGAPDPVRELRDRERNAIAKRIVDPRRAAVEASGVDGAATPPKATTTPTSKPSPPRSPNGSPAPASTTEAKTPDSPASESSEGAETDSAAPTKEAAPEAKGPRYDVKSFKKWAEQNPEQAAEIASEVFRVEQDPKQEWIRQQNKARKIKDDVRREKETAASELTAKEQAIQVQAERVEKVAAEVRPIIDMWHAAKRVNAQGQPDPDFDTVDEAFRQSTGLSIDDYNRSRARRGVATPELARERARAAKAERELAALKAQQTNGAAAGSTVASAAPAPTAAVPAEPAAPAAPTVQGSWREDEVPKVHPLRQFTGWQLELDAEMEKYHDETLDEYSRDPEEVADALFKRKMKALAGDEEEEAPAPRTRAAAKTPSTPKTRAGRTAFSDSPEPGIPAASKLAPRGKVNHDRSHKETTLQEIVTNDGGMAERTRYAMERAQRRLRGEQVDD